jgi:hypothetical protein
MAIMAIRRFNQIYDQIQSQKHGMINLLGDSGRFGGNAAAYTLVGTYAKPTYIQMYNSTTHAQNGRIIYNNNDFSGNSGTMNDSARTWIDTYMAGATSNNKRYHIESNIMRLTSGSGVDVPITRGATTLYLRTTNNNIILPSAYTAFMYLKVISGTWATSYTSSMDTVNNVATDLNQKVFTSADGWCRVVQYVDLTENTGYIGYNTTSPFGLWSSGTGDVIDLVRFGLCAGILDIPLHQMPLANPNNYA